MTRQLEEQQEKRQAQRNREVLKAIEFELEGAVAHAGGILTGLSMKIGEVDCLLTLRVVLAGKPQIAFVGGPNMGDCFRKAVRDAYQDKLRWRADQYGRNED